MPKSRPFQTVLTDVKTDVRALARQRAVYIVELACMGIGEAARMVDSSKQSFFSTWRLAEYDITSEKNRL